MRRADFCEAERVDGRLEGERRGRSGGSAGIAAAGRGWRRRAKEVAVVVRMGARRGMADGVSGVAERHTRAGAGGEELRWRPCRRLAGG